jgi:hypothetical protein
MPMAAVELEEVQAEPLCGLLTCGKADEDWLRKLRDFRRIGFADAEAPVVG